jgi:hypothetical protein
VVLLARGSISWGQSLSNPMDLLTATIQTELKELKEVPPSVNGDCNRRSQIRLSRIQKANRAGGAGRPHVWKLA